MIPNRIDDGAAGTAWAPRFFGISARTRPSRNGRHPANVCCVMLLLPSAERSYRQRVDDARWSAWALASTPYPGSPAQTSAVDFRPCSNMPGGMRIVIEGKADSPVWVDIRNSKVIFHDAQDLWGKDTWATQLEIRDRIKIRRGTKTHWQDLRALSLAESDESSGEDVGRTTQKPAILCIGLAGENQTCHAALIHDAGNGAGQGGLGAVWGSKNLKAISVLGTGGIKVRRSQGPCLKPA